MAIHRRGVERSGGEVDVRLCRLYRICGSWDEGFMHLYVLAKGGMGSGWIRGRRLSRCLKNIHSTRKNLFSRSLPVCRDCRTFTLTHVPSHPRIEAYLDRGKGRSSIPSQCYTPPRL